MKAKIIIENGETEIVLTPENPFDKDLVEKMYEHKERFSVHTQVEADYTYAHYQNHRLVINVKEVK